MYLIKISMRKLKKFFSMEAEMKRSHLFIPVEAGKGSEEIMRSKELFQIFKEDI
jgi:hypothetical protein